MKKIAISLLLIALMVGVAYGAAAALPISGGTIQVGEDSDLTCDPDGVSVSYNTDWRGVVTSILIYDIEAACEGNRLMVAISSGGDTLIATSGALDSNTGGAPVTPVAVPLFEDLYNAPCDQNVCKVQLAAVDANGSPLTGNNHGVAGGSIAKILITIEGDNS